MSSFLHRHAWNQRVQLGAAALAGGVVTASLLLSYQKLRRKERVDALKSSIPSLEEQDKQDGKHVDVRTQSSISSKTRSAS